MLHLRRKFPIVVFAIEEASGMKTFVFAYLGGMVASIPAFAMFNNAGASPFINYQALDAQINRSLTSLLIALALVWVVPAFGSALGAKIGGRQAEFHYIYGRGVGGQFIFSIVVSLLVTSTPEVRSMVMGMPLPMQTIVFLMASQIGCVFGTVWGY